MNDIADFRRRGRFAEALDRFYSAAEPKGGGGSPPDLWLEHFFACDSPNISLLLEAVKAAPADSKRFGTLVEECWDKLCRPKDHQSLSAQLSLIRAAWNDGTKPSIQTAVLEYQQLWGVTESSVPAALPATDGRRTPWLLNQSTPDVLKKTQQLLDDLTKAGEASEEQKRKPDWVVPRWENPAIIAVAEGIAWLLGEELPKVERTVETWVLLAGSQPEEASDGEKYENKLGLLAKLTLERIANRRGCGLLYPDILRMGFFRCDETFQTGLRHAWEAVIRGDANFKARSFDIRWRLTFFPNGSTQQDLDLLTARITGRSAEVAIACALKALSDPDQLDDLDSAVAITACFESELFNPNPIGVGASGKGDLTPSSAHADGVAVKHFLRLGRVEDVSTKLLAVVKSRHIKHVVVASDQPELKQSEWTADTAEPRLISAATFDDAYREASWFLRITRDVKRKLAERAITTQQQQCQADWVPPLVVRLVPKQHDTAVRHEHQRELEEQQLEEQQFREVLTLRWPSNDPASSEQVPYGARIQLLAESAMGKTSFLVQAEHEIAAANDDRVPVRIGGPLPRGPVQDRRLPLISEPKWDRADIRDYLADRLFTDFIAKKDERHRWFDWLINTGRACFLLDAIDQKHTPTDGLPGFLESGEMKRCPVIISGRLESKGETVFLTDATWTLLRVKGFDEGRQRTYLGPALSARLVDDATVGPQLVELRTVPLLLRLLKEMAEDATAPDMAGLDFRRRESVYRHALDRLIERGITKAKDSPLAHDQPSQAEEWDKSTIRQALGEVAFEMIRWNDCREGPRQELSPQELKQFQRLNRTVGGEFHDTPREVLKGVGLLVLGTVLEDPREPGLVWRHLSFAEYFAGCYLAELLWNTPSQTDGSTMVRAFFQAVMKVPTEQEQSGYCQAVDAWLADPTRGHPVLSRFPERWRWVFRFALAHADSQKQPQVVNALVEELTRHANPFVVFEAIALDHVTLDPELETLCRWLVHYNYDSRWGDNGFYTQAIPETDAFFEFGTNLRSLSRLEMRNSESFHVEYLTLVPRRSLPVLTDRTRPLCESQFDRMYRRSTVLVAAIELLTGQRLEDLLEWQLDTVVALFQQHDHFPELLAALGKFRDTFQRCPNVGDWVECVIGEDDLSRNRCLQREQFKSEPYFLADFPVTNQLFEWFDPGHFADRDQYSSHDLQPVVYVNWYQAKLFCLWLNAMCWKAPDSLKAPRPRYELPDERRWEAACKAGQDQVPEIESGLTADDVNCFQTRLDRTSRRHEFPKDSTRQSFVNPWGLLDMRGNVSEWCNDLRMDEIRVTRGGSFRVSGGPYQGTESVHREKNVVVVRVRDFGFRVCCVSGREEL